MSEASTRVTLRSELTVDLIRDGARLESDQSLSAVVWPAFDAEPQVALRLGEEREHRFEPYAIVVKDGDEVVAAAMMRIDEIELTVKLGYRLAFRPRCRALVAQHGGVVGDEPGTVALLEAIRRGLREEGAVAALIPGLRLDSTFATGLRSLPWALRGHFEQRRIHRRVSIPASLDEFIAARSRETRRNISRSRKAVLKHVASPSIRLYREREELDELVTVLEDLVSRTWQGSLGVGFATSPTELALYRLALARQAFRCWVLFDGAKPIAFLLGLIHRGCLYGRYMAYDQAYAEARPGNYLFVQLVSDLCADDRIHAYDFGAGDSQFKRTLSDESWWEADLVVFASSPRAICINLIRSLVNAAAYAGKQAVNRSDRLGALWANRRKTIAASQEDSRGT